MKDQNKIHIALVTGASSGIGKAICLLLLDKGFRVIGVSRSENALAQIQKESSFGHNFTYQVCDLSQKSEVKKLIQQILEGTPSIDMLVNNAGVFLPGGIEGEEDEVYETMMRTNMDSAYYLTKGLLNHLNKGGYIFNMCSTASKMGYPNGGSYCVSKFALLGFSKALRQELAGRIAVSAIMPGATLTRSWAGTEEPNERFMRPEDVALALWSSWQMRSHTVVEEIVMRPLLGDF